MTRVVDALQAPLSAVQSLTIVMEVKVRTALVSLLVKRIALLLPLLSVALLRPLLAAVDVAAAAATPSGGAWLCTQLVQQRRRGLLALKLEHEQRWVVRAQQAGGGAHGHGAG